MYLNHRINDRIEALKVISWHEDTTQEGNYVLTLQTAQGNRLQAVERSDLTAEQIAELKSVPKDSTAL